MKKTIFLACLAILSIAPMTSAYGEQSSIGSQHDGIYVVTVRNGIVNVLSDEVHIVPLTNDDLSSENIASLKEAWKQCYGAMLLNKKSTLDSFFVTGLPNVLQTLDKNEGQVKIFTTSRVKNTIRLILKYEVMQSPNSVNIIYDAHIWSINDKGKWEVKSAVYQ
jgi:hypothetical protein